MSCGRCICRRTRHRAPRMSRVSWRSSTSGSRRSNCRSGTVSHARRSGWLEIDLAQLVADHPQLFWGLVASFWIGNIFLLLLNIPLIGIWAYLVSVPRRFFFPVIITLICTGVYGIANSTFDIWAVLAMGVLGYIFRVFGYSPAPLLIGFVLGPMVEQYLRRALMISNGDYSYLLSSSTSIGIHCLTLAVLLWPLLKALWPRPSDTATAS